MACIPCIYFLKRIILNMCNDIPNIKDNRCISYCCTNTKKSEEIIQTYKNDQVKF